MNKAKKTALIILISVVVLIMGFTAIFFATAFERVSRTIFEANNADVSEIINEEYDEDSWITPENFLKARVVSDSISMEDKYVNFKTKYSIPTIKNGEFSFKCNIKAFVHGWDDDSKETFEGKREIVLVFEKWQWNVKDVKEFT